MGYVDKVKKNEVLEDIHDARIEDPSAFATKAELVNYATKEEVAAVKPFLDGTALVIPTQPAPEPVATIDGVDYYHKHEFDLAEIPEEVAGTWYNLLTGEKSTEYANEISALVVVQGPPGPKYVNLRLSSGIHTFEKCVYSANQYMQVNYQSQAFTVVNKMTDVTDQNRICLPTCSAYYGWLSEDGNTFISYFNLKDEGVTTKIDSIKQGSATIPLADNRLPEAAPADEGKVVKVGATGEYELEEAEPEPTLELSFTLSDSITVAEFVTTYRSQFKDWKNTYVDIVFEQSPTSHNKVWLRMQVGPNQLELGSREIVEGKLIGSQKTEPFDSTETMYGFLFSGMANSVPMPSDSYAKKYLRVSANGKQLEYEDPVPQATAADEGKVPIVNASGSYELKDFEEKPTEIDLTSFENPSYQDLHDAVAAAGLDADATNYVKIAYIGPGHLTTYAIGWLHSTQSPANLQWDFIMTYAKIIKGKMCLGRVQYSSGEAGKLTDRLYETYDFPLERIQPLWGDADLWNYAHNKDSAKTYVCKLVNGKPTWVEETPVPGVTQTVVKRSATQSELDTLNAIDKGFVTAINITYVINGNIVLVDVRLNVSGSFQEMSTKSISFDIGSNIELESEMLKLNTVGDSSDITILAQDSAPYNKISINQKHASSGSAGATMHTMFIGMLKVSE